MKADASGLSDDVGGAESVGMRSDPSTGTVPRLEDNEDGPGAVGDEEDNGVAIDVECDESIPTTV